MFEGADTEIFFVRREKNFMMAVVGGLWIGKDANQIIPEVTFLSNMHIIAI